MAGGASGIGASSAAASSHQTQSSSKSNAKNNQSFEALLSQLQSKKQPRHSLQLHHASASAASKSVAIHF